MSKVGQEVISHFGAHNRDYLGEKGFGRSIEPGNAPLSSIATLSCYISLRKRGSFYRKIPPRREARCEMLSWLMFVASGLGPYSGQSVHFRNYAPEKLPYAINRYTFEAQRHFRILDERLAEQHYMLGDTYTIIDMDVWGWARLIPTVMGEGAGDKFSNLKRLVDEISARPAAQRAVALKDKHKFKTEMDSEALDAMFPHLKQKAA